jgi:hypothetical protein
MKSGYGVYGLTALIHDSTQFTVIAAGGHWKFPNNKENNGHVFEFRPSGKEEHSIFMYPFHSLSYNSGVAVGNLKNTNKWKVITVGTNGIVQQQFSITNQQLAGNNQQFSGINRGISSDEMAVTPAKANRKKHNQKKINSNADYSKNKNSYIDISWNSDSVKSISPNQLNAVRFDGNHFWIIGSNGQIYCI